MKVSEVLESRRVFWRELEDLCTRLRGRSRRRMSAATVSRFSVLYRAACADLALADAYQLPPGTVHYLHQLVARAHNQLYRSRTFNFRAWLFDLFVAVPQRLFADNCLRLAFVLFWGIFVGSGLLAYYTSDFAQQVVGRDQLMHMESNFASPIEGRPIGESGVMGGFYVFNNPGIGLACFCWGLVFGIGGLYLTISNALMLGTVFGYMAKTPSATNFYHFVTAHGPFELTAVVLCAAAGMRLGFSIVNTRGYTRGDSLRRAAKMVVPALFAAVLLFLVAAAIEAFVSPSAAPYELKAAVAIVCTLMLLFYFIFLGYPRKATISVPTT
jgi:uncharacterized membrane protein SpoIIM required for sporulation